LPVSASKVKKYIIIFIFVFLLIFAAVKTWNSYRLEKNALTKASELPARFVLECQNIGNSYDISWFYLAVYYQINIEKRDRYKYPDREQIIKLARDLKTGTGKGIKKRLMKMDGGDFTKSVITRARQLKKAQNLFSPLYVFPVAAGKIWYTDTWLAPRDRGKRKHLGTDVFAPEGTPLYACVDGVIERKGWNRLGGEKIGLQGEDGIYYYYAHLQNYAPGLEEGMKVPKGTIIGYVGHTGNAEQTPDHLHFGMKTKWGNWINPYNFLKYWELVGKRSQA